MILALEPQRFSSWTVLDELTVLKTIDKSCLLHHGTAIPKELSSYFDNITEYQKIILEHNNKSYDAKLNIDSSNRVRMFWTNSFSRLLEDYVGNFDQWNSRENKDFSPQIRFVKKNPLHFQVTIITKQIFKYEDSFTNEDDLENTISSKEGRLIYRKSRQYERNPKNRRLAIQYHGLTCNICGFNFEKVYDKYGAGYIEVHHINPLHLSQEEVIINPKTDLITICSNCHRIIHRSRDNPLSIEEMKILFI